MGQKMPYVPFNERDHEYYATIARMRKNPSMPFSDPAFAKKASKKGVKARSKNVLPKKQLLQDSKAG